MERRPRIAIAEPKGFSPRARALLAEVGDVVEGYADADVLWVRLRQYIGAAIMDAAPSLRVIATPTTGLNHIDMREAERRGIAVLSLRGEREFLDEVRATAEHTLALMLALLRRIPEAVEHVRRGEWDRDRLRGCELYGKTVGIVGYGRLGRIVARYVHAFEARVVTSDPHVRAADAGRPLVPLDELLTEADIVTLHVNLTPENQGFFGRREFAAMRRGSWFINTSRGELVDEAAMIEALESGWLAGAAVDVVSDEYAASRRPPVHRNLIVTPHIGGCTVESMEKTEVFLARKVREAVLSMRQPLLG